MRSSSSSSDDGAMKTSTRARRHALDAEAAPCTSVRTYTSSPSPSAIDDLLPRHAGAVAVDDGVLEQPAVGDQPVEIIAS